MKENKIVFNKGSDELTLILNNRCDYVSIERQMYEQGWKVFSINDKKIETICECGDAVFQKGAKYCDKCLDNNKKGSISAVTHKYGRDKAQRK